jgi:peroxiredoxin Q/BCP
MKGKSTTRGVFVVDKAGKVLAAEPGSPDGTVAVVGNLVTSIGNDSTTAPTAPGEQNAAGQETTSDSKAKEDTEKANVAADVADTAKKLDNDETKDGASAAV